VRTSHRIRRWKAGDRLPTPDVWLAGTPQREGSWWTPWFDWLRRHSSGSRKPPAIGGPSAALRPLGDAPGRYVLQR
jgi:polyhydroxyalkanoate synthase